MESLCDEVMPVCVVGALSAVVPRYYVARKRGRDHDADPLNNDGSITLSSSAFHPNASLDVVVFAWPQVVLRLEAPLHAPLPMRVDAACRVRVGELLVVSGCGERCELAAHDEPVVEEGSKAALPVGYASQSETLLPAPCLTRRHYQIDPYDGTVAFQQSSVRLLTAVRRGRLDTWWCREVPASNRDAICKILRKGEFVTAPSQPIDPQVHDGCIRVKASEIRRVTQWWILGEGNSNTPTGVYAPELRASDDDGLQQARGGTTVTAKVARLLRGLQPTGDSETQFPVSTALSVDTLLAEVGAGGGVGAGRR